MQAELHAIFSDSIEAKRRFLRDHGGALERVVLAVARALRGGHKLLLFGNGGSAADAQHIAAEFVNRFSIDRPPLPALALTTDTSAITSIANDFGYDSVFAKQVEALGRRGDVAIAISTSGKSASVLRAVDVCRRSGIPTVGLTGGDGGPLGRRVDHHLCVAGTTRTARIQETHILVGHAICDLVDRVLFGDLRGLLKSAPRRAPGTRAPRRQAAPGARRR